MRIMSRTPIRRRAVVAVVTGVVAAVGLGGAGGAFAESDLVDLKVVDRDTGRPLHVWRHDGRLFVAGQPGARYSLRVTNHTDGRVLVVMSVDGVNIITGETAGYDQRGYVLDPRQAYDATGWRKSDAEVAAFTFAPLPQSYAARTGRPADVGVIGMAVFQEKAALQVAAAPVMAPGWRDQLGTVHQFDLPTEPVVTGGAPAPSNSIPAPVQLSGGLPPPPPPRPTITGGAGSTPSADVSLDGIPDRPDEKLGTSHGAREPSVTYTVVFERATPYPRLVQQIEYDTRDNLVASGVIPSPASPGRRPRPFPARPSGEGYVPDPPQGP